MFLLSGFSKSVLEELLQFHQRQLRLWSKRLDRYEQINSRLDQLLRPWPASLLSIPCPQSVHDEKAEDPAASGSPADVPNASKSASAELVSEVDRLLAKANSVIAAKSSSSEQRLDKDKATKTNATKRVSTSAGSATKKPAKSSQQTAAPAPIPAVKPSLTSASVKQKKPTNGPSYKPAHVTAPFRTDPSLHRRVAVNQQYRNAGRNKARAQAAAAAAEAARPARLVGQWLGSSGRISKSAETAAQSDAAQHPVSVGAPPIPTARRSLSADAPLPPLTSTNSAAATNATTDSSQSQSEPVSISVPLSSVPVPEAFSVAIETNRRLRRRLRLAVSKGRFSANSASPAERSFVNKLGIATSASSTSSAKPRTAVALAQLLDNLLAELNLESSATAAKTADNDDLSSVRRFIKIRRLYELLKSTKLGVASVNNNKNKEDDDRTRSLLLGGSAFHLANLPLVFPYASERCLALSSRLPSLVVQADLSSLLLSVLKSKSACSLIKTGTSDPIAFRQLWALAGGGGVPEVDRCSWSNGKRPHLPVTISTVL